MACSSQGMVRFMGITATAGVLRVRSELLPQALPYQHLHSLYPTPTAKSQAEQRTSTRGLKLSSALRRSQWSTRVPAPGVQSHKLTWTLVQLSGDMSSPCQQRPINLPGPATGCTSGPWKSLEALLPLKPTSVGL